MKINHTELHIIQGDITHIEADIIVTTANTEFTMDKGLAAAIKASGGQAIEDEAQPQGPVEKGSVVATTAGLLSARYVIHAAIHESNMFTDEVTLRTAIRNSLSLAQQKKVSSIAFPAIGCTHGGFAPKAAAKILAQEIYKHAFYDKDALSEIHIVLYDEVMCSLYQEQITRYLDHLQKKMSQGPFITVDIIIEVEGGVVLIERSNPPFGWALPGGFVDYGETLEECAIREAKEETGLDIYNVKQMHTYSDPRRDPRFHTITTVFVAEAKGTPKAGDDAQNARVVSLDESTSVPLAFDHAAVLDDYKQFRQGREMRRD